MPDTVVTGKKRSGKSLAVVGMAREALLQGRRVAANFDIYLDKLMPPDSKVTYIRLPDRPTAADFVALGRGQEGCDDDENGYLLLDEISTFFNARAWGDKERQPLLDWFVHSGKFGWSTWWICQGVSQIDKQLRECQLEYHMIVKRTDKWPIPLVTPLTAMLGRAVTWPKMHVAITKQGLDRDSLLVSRKFYRSADLYPCYDTTQVFLPREHPDAVAIHTSLSAWHLKGRYLKPARSRMEILAEWWRDLVNGPERVAVQLKPKAPLVALLAKLPPDEALKHWRRLESLGAI